MVMNKSLQVGSLVVMLRTRLTTRQEVNIQNMNVELVAQMFKNYQSNVLFHLEGKFRFFMYAMDAETRPDTATENLQEPS
jgi:DASH complex subunit DAD4